MDNILRFERDFDGAQVIRLERNYRSTSHILAAASGLIAVNKGRFGPNFNGLKAEKPIRSKANHRPFRWPSRWRNADCAAARRATGTRKGEHET